MTEDQRVRLLLCSIALEPNRWTADKIPHFRLIDLLPAIKAHGFSELEVWQYHVDRLTKGELNELRSAMEEQGVSAPVLGIYPRLHLEGAHVREELSHVVGLLDTAVFLGSETVKMFAGSVPSARLSNKGRLHSIRFLQEMSDLAEEREIRLTAESHANTLFDTIESSLRSLEKLDARRFGVCFQPYDANVLGAMGAFTALRDRIRHLHLQGRSGDSISLLEDADLDYGRFLAFVHSTDFAGYVCIEFVKDCVVASPELLDVDLVLANAERDREFVRNLLPIVD